jgi:hypothetical protein
MFDKTDANWHRTQPKLFSPEIAGYKIGLDESFHNGVFSAELP